MCLAIPGQIVEIVDEDRNIGMAEVSGVRRQVNIGLLTEGPDKVEVGDWVLIHVGFAMSKVDEEEANATRDFLLTLGEAYESELEELQKSNLG
jgi:hydrogenase expression/formation protein HypC